MSDDTPKSEAASSPPAPRPRSPVERTIVWGLIGVLLALVVIEARARFGYTLSLNALQSRADQVDVASADGEPAKEMTLSEARQLVQGGLFKTQPTEVAIKLGKAPQPQGFFPLIKPEPDESMRKNEVVFTWAGLLKTYGSIHLGRENDPPPPDEPLANPLVWIVKQPGAPKEAAPEVGTLVADEPDPEMPDMPRAPMMAGPGGGGGGGGAEVDLMEFDADGDGRVSLEEIPEDHPARRFFDRIDTNGDGFLDADEIAASRQRRAERQARDQAAEDAPDEKSDGPVEAPALPESAASRQQADETR